MIGIYSDIQSSNSAVWPKGLDKIISMLSKHGVDNSIINRNQINDNKFQLNQFSAIIFPGGWAYPGYVSHIKLPAKQKLKKFVTKQGGTFVGICAGAYFACEGVTWIDEHLDIWYNTGIYPWRAIGPAYKSTKELVWKKDIITFKDFSIKMSYAQAPSFIVSEDVEILGKYPDGTAAVVKSTWKGEKIGKVILWGPHPELSSDKRIQKLFIESTIS